MANTLKFHIRFSFCRIAKYAYGLELSWWETTPSCSLVLIDFFQWHVVIFLVVNSRNPNRSFCRAAATHNAHFFSNPTKHSIILSDVNSGYSTNCRAFSHFGVDLLRTSQSYPIHFVINRVRCNSIFVSVEFRKLKYDDVLWCCFVRHPNRKSFYCVYLSLKDVPFTILTMS